MKKKKTFMCVGFLKRSSRQLKEVGAGEIKKNRGGKGSCNHLQKEKHFKKGEHNWEIRIVVGGKTFSKGVGKLSLRNQLETKKQNY